jgi:hypothetical protein
MSETTHKTSNPKDQPTISINVSPTPIKIETTPPVINLPPPDDKHEEKANKIAWLSMLINAGLLVLTLAAIWYTSKSVNIAAAALQMSKANDSLSSLRMQTADSINADIIKANKIRDSISLRLSEASIQSQLKSINEAQKQFAIEHEPFLQVSDVKVQPFDEDSVVSIEVELENLTKVPVKIMGSHDTMVIAGRSVPERKLRSHKIEISDHHLYVTDNSAATMIFQPVTLPITLDDFYTKMNNGKDLYFLAVIKYQNLSNEKLKFYRFFLKIHAYPVSDIYPDGMTTWTFIKNENLDKL